MHAIAGTTSLSPTMLATINAPRYATMIPNRIFVGGIDFKTSEDDLQNFFQEFGTVIDTKIIRDRADVSKGYGFVTFNSPDEAMKVQEQGDYLYLKGKKLNIAPAVRKLPSNYPKDIHVAGPVGSWVIHPGGYASLTTSNGSTYFQPVVGAQVGVHSQNSQYVMSYNAPPVSAMPQQIVSPPGHYATYPTGIITQAIPSNYMQWNTGSVPPGACGQLISAAPQPQEPMQHPQGMVQPSSVESCSPNVTMTTVRPVEHTCTQQPGTVQQVAKIGQVVASPMSPVQLQMQPTYAQIPNNGGIPVRHSVIQAVPENQQMCSPGRHQPHFNTMSQMSNGEVVVSGHAFPYCYQPAYPVGTYANVYENQPTQTQTVCDMHAQTPPLQVTAKSQT